MARQREERLGGDVRTDIMVRSFVIATSVSAGGNIGFYWISRDTLLADMFATITCFVFFFVGIAIATVHRNSVGKLYRGIKDTTYFVETIAWRRASRDEKIFLASTMAFMPMMGISLGGLFALMYLDMVN